MDYNLEDLCKQYGAVFLGFGANISCKMGVPGENLKGVFGGNELLEKNLHPDYKDKKVAVIGGGNVAMDVARTIRRLGAKEVNVIYRRAEKQMPAERKEIEDAKQEGVNFLFQNNIVGINGNSDGEVESIECVRTELVRAEGDSRERPVNVDGSNYTMDMDFVMMAIGGKPDNVVLSGIGVELNKWGYIAVDDEYRTSVDKVFAGGDLIGTTATVAWAARDGRDAAKSIVKCL